MTDEREDQIRNVRNQEKKKRRPVVEAVGHEKYLNFLERGKAIVTITTNRGAEFSGRVKHSDKFTISMELDDEHNPGRTYTKVFFKANIESFDPAPPVTEDAQASH